MFKATFRARRRIYQTFRPALTRRMPMRLLKWGSKMPSSKQYDLVTNDDYDTRIPLHPDEAFQYGITFQAKYIGTMDVPRPTSRVEIVAAMRRVRYEFKAKGVKKRKVTVDVSTEGVRVTTRKKKSKSKKKERSKLFGSNSSNNTPVEIMHHPIYRIFYVSHDSSDLKIFSYIARDGATNVFKCNVFKSNKKSQAMRIVRTVGQAFEVCHKLTNNSQDGAPASTSSAADEAAASDRLSDIAISKEAVSEVVGATAIAPTTVREEDEASGGSSAQIQQIPKHLDLLPPPPRSDRKRSPQLMSTPRPTPAPTINLLDLPECVTKVEVGATLETPSANENGTSLSAQHQLQLLRERLEQQAQQTRAAVAQLLLLRDQLAAEQAARCEAQARTHQLLVHNKELLEHIAGLVAHLQERERGSTKTAISAQQLTLLPQTTLSQPGNAIMKSESFNNNAQRPRDIDAAFNLISQTNQQNVENNNVRLSPFAVSPVTPGTPVNGPTTPLNFGNMTNEHIQNYLITKFQNATLRSRETENNVVCDNNNQQFFQNCKAFPNIPPLTNHYSNMDLSDILNCTPQRNGHSADNLDLAQENVNLKMSQNTIFSLSTATTSKGSTPDTISSDDGVPFIMPLSHNATLKATGEDGRVRLIVPVSPSGSVSDVVELHNIQQDVSGHTLRVPCNDLPVPSTNITRTTSEKVPNRSEMMTAMRSQWTRHTTK